MGDTGLEPVTSSVSCWRASQLRQSPGSFAVVPEFYATRRVSQGGWGNRQHRPRTVWGGLREGGGNWLSRRLWAIFVDAPAVAADIVGRTFFSVRVAPAFAA